MSLVVQQKRSLKVELLITQLARVNLHIFHKRPMHLQRYGFDEPSEAPVAFVGPILAVRLLELAMALVGMIVQFFLGDEGLIASAATNDVLSADVDHGYLRQVRIVAFGWLLQE